MAEATVSFALGTETVTSVLAIDLGGSETTSIVGNFAGLIPSGEHGHITGNVNLTGDLIVEGLLTGIDTFTVEGNGFQILIRNGGVENLVGVEKTAWINWNGPVVGWQVGDRLVVAPTQAGQYFPVEMTWTGSWATMTRPPISPDVTLVDGSVVKPEVANLSQTIVLKNMRRASHFHDGAGIQTLKWVKALNCGTTTVLGDYPFHFHLNGDTSRGSLLEGVVVEAGKHHAFVPHGSHGITFKDCVSYAAQGSAFWWDFPPESNTASRENDSDDTVWDHCLVIRQRGLAGFDSLQFAGFVIGAGFNNVCHDCVAVAVDGNGTGQRSGFLWKENTSRGPWEFSRNLAHNCRDSGIFVWQNTSGHHTVFDYDAYRCGFKGIDHGAYTNNYHYRDITLTGAKTIVHAKSFNPAGPNSDLIFENIVSDTQFEITQHGASHLLPAYVRNCSFPRVVYSEVTFPSYWRYEDCGLVPADFLLTKINAASIIEIREAGVLEHRWSAGVWS